MIWGVGFGDFSGIVSHLKTPENEGMSAEEGPSLGTILKGSRVVFQASIFRCENVSFREGGWTSTEKKSFCYGWMDAIFAGFGGARANHGRWTQACKEQQKTWCFLVQNSRVEIERWGFIVRWSQFI